MKNLAILFAIVLCTGFNLMAQAPLAFRFQSVLRDDQGEFITTALNVRLSLLSGSLTGSAVYTHEEFTTPTSNGVISINMGTDNPADFAAIDWAAGPFFLKVEMNRGNGYEPVGDPVQILSVPYALYAEHGGDNPWSVGTDSLYYHENAVSVGKPGESNVLLNLNSEQNWQFRQKLAGNTAGLELASIGGGGNKDFMLNTTGLISLGNTTPVSTQRVNIYGQDNNGSFAALTITSEGGQKMLIDGDEIDGASNNLNLNHNSSSNVLIVNGGGKVGIGTTNPTDKLSVMGNIGLPADGRILARGDNGAFAIYKNSNATDSRSWIELHGNTTNRVGELALAGTYLSFRSNSTTTSTGTERMRITADGNVGIGTATPTALLTVSNAANAKIEFKRGSATGAIEQNSSGGALRLENITGDDIIQLRTYGPSYFNGGNVGIGTTNPSKAKLVVEGSADFNVGVYHTFDRLSSSTAIDYDDIGNKPLSVYASEGIAANAFHAFSDKRIKSIKGISNSQNDLRTLMGIEVTNYSLIDSIEKGNKMYKKVIAQQVEKVYPQAVSTMTDVVPDIYKMAAIKMGRVTVPNTLKAGEKVKLILEDRTELAEVLSADAAGFNVNLSDEGRVFVFGREVNDFRTVDYEAISMLNVSATQELAKIIEQQKAEIANLQSTHAQVLARLEQLEASLSNVQKASAETGNSK